MPSPPRPTPASTPSPAKVWPSLAGAAVVVDVSNAPSCEDAAVLEFFETSTRNSSTQRQRPAWDTTSRCRSSGADRLADSGYLRAKVAQEKLIKSSSIPYSIVHATQFFEFATRIADEATDGDTVRVPPVLIQPMAADDVAAAVCNVALAAPLQRHDRDRWARAFRSRISSARVARRGGSARGRGRSSSSVLRGPTERAHPCAG